MQRVFLLLTLVLVGCSSPATQKQCDPSRRCSPADAPVCGEDGSWYECGLVAECEQVAVSFDNSACDEPAPECEELVCRCNDPVLRYDDDGVCPTSCSCQPECPAIGLDCPTEPGPDGCPVCVTCPDIQCDASCDLVQRPGECATCECEPTCDPPGTACADPDCIPAVDENGCGTCECGPPPTCEQQFCEDYCPYGYLMEAGCPTCECYEPCQELPECDLACPNGYGTDQATGCSTSCECLADSCPGVDCDLACEFGFRTDTRGCEQCECQGQPCTSSVDCTPDQVCVGADFVAGECVDLQKCDGAADCPADRPCGFYFREDCCPPATSCLGDDDGLIPACETVCLLGVGDLPRSVTF